MQLAFPSLFVVGLGTSATAPGPRSSQEATATSAVVRSTGAARHPSPEHIPVERFTSFNLSSTQVNTSAVSNASTERS
ncbi:unnamed protein product [Hermetia illucens]|uniref:Secreted protein n=1 Tax=Hermetia illucens TaxID=343691 RepID=A0A7R8UDR3_HERIL|nr:unnamed protein product [Hermetia illucens]